jgi:hypothetical protein
MGNLKRFLILCFLAINALPSFASEKLAIINDPDGYTNIRSGQGIDFPVIATVNKDDFFYCDMSGSAWLKVVTMQWKGDFQVKGYINRSKVQLVSELETDKQRELINHILTEQKTLAINFQKACTSHDSLAYATAVRALENYGNEKYEPILDILPSYFCKTKDVKMLALFCKTMWADGGTACETPSFVIGDCFVCQPDIVLNQLHRIKNKEERKLLLDDVEWGLLNHFDICEDCKSTNKELNSLKKKLDKEKKGLKLI